MENAPLADVRLALWWVVGICISNSARQHIDTRFKRDLREQIPTTDGRAERSDCSPLLLVDGYPRALGAGVPRGRDPRACWHLALPPGHHALDRGLFSSDRSEQPHSGRKWFVWVAQAVVQAETTATKDQTTRVPRPKKFAAGSVQVERSLSIPWGGDTIHWLPTLHPEQICLH